jgi:uncharacterized protein YndB with AHSA1/START domain
MSGSTRDITNPLRVTTPSDVEIQIERIFDATRDRVWRAFTEPDLLAQWWGRGNKLVIERLELKPGGHWRFVEHGPDGIRGFEGHYREVTPTERLVWTFGRDGIPGYMSINTVIFEDLGDDRTRVINRVLFDTKEGRDGMLQYGIEGGLAPTYAALDALLEKLA